MSIFSLSSEIVELLTLLDVCTLSFIRGVCAHCILNDLDQIFRHLTLFIEVVSKISFAEDNDKGKIGKN